MNFIFPPTWSVQIPVVLVRTNSTLPPTMYGDVQDQEQVTPKLGSGGGSALSTHTQPENDPFSMNEVTKGAD